MIWTHSLREGRRAAIAPRQLSGRGLSYWTDGTGDDRVIYVTTGHRLVELNAKNGATIPLFGKDGIVDLKIGARSKAKASRSSWRSAAATTQASTSPSRCPLDEVSNASYVASAFRRTVISTVV